MTSSLLADIATDPDRFEVFYREHVAAVQTFVARRAPDPATAADLTADIFLTAIDKAHRYDPARGEPRAWLIGIARLTIADERRRSARRARADSRISGRRLLDPDSYQRVAEQLDAERHVRTLYRRIEALSARHRAVLELVALDGLDVADAAAVLGISAGTARVRLHRARRQLAQRTSDPSTAVPAEEIR